MVNRASPADWHSKNCFSSISVYQFTMCVKTHSASSSINGIIHTVFAHQVLPFCAEPCCVQPIDKKVRNFIDTLRFVTLNPSQLQLISSGIFCNFVCFVVFALHQPQFASSFRVGHVGVPASLEKWFRHPMLKFFCCLVRRMFLLWHRRQQHRRAHCIETPPFSIRIEQERGVFLMKGKDPGSAATLNN